MGLTDGDVRPMLPTTAPDEAVTGGAEKTDGALDVLSVTLALSGIVESSSVIVSDGASDVCLRRSTTRFLRLRVPWDFGYRVLLMLTLEAEAKLCNGGRT